MRLVKACFRERVGAPYWQVRGPWAVTLPFCIACCGLLPRMSAVVDAGVDAIALGPDVSWSESSAAVWLSFGGFAHAS